MQAHVVSIRKFRKRVLSPRKHSGCPVGRSASEGTSSGLRERREHGHDGQDEKDGEEHVQVAIG